ncbi:hypothetical protein NDU88_000087 [Pleurodeles waltl]|uniref:Uncharacterized protein n=1 Tax=Pleurodeles waltl TaxID=8319 RepID=A0AAV7WHY2_PLEWA|nr:hypothetical protein NDU88_000087 [Pleurodeles waltl]
MWGAALTALRGYKGHLESGQLPLTLRRSSRHRPSAEVLISKGPLPQQPQHPRSTRGVKLGAHHGELLRDNGQRDPLCLQLCFLLLGQRLGYSGSGCPCTWSEHRVRAATDY